MIGKEYQGDKALERWEWGVRARREEGRNKASVQEQRVPLPQGQAQGWAALVESA